MKLVHNILSTSGRFSVIQASDRPFPNSGGVVVVFSNCQLPIVNCTSSTFHSKFSVLYSKFSFSQGFLYAPFGEITTEFNATFGNDIIPKYSFNAKELDEETGMYYYEARYYKPPVFTSRDALMEQKPWLTPYHYCSNNPVGRMDPSGLTDYDVETENGIVRKKINDGQNVYRIEVSTKEYNKLERKFNRNQNRYEKYRDKLKDKNGYTTGHPKGGIIFHRPINTQKSGKVNEAFYGAGLEISMLKGACNSAYPDNVPLKEAKIAKGFDKAGKYLEYTGSWWSEFVVYKLSCFRRRPNNLGRRFTNWYSDRCIYC